MAIGDILGAIAEGTKTQGGVGGLADALMRIMLRNDRNQQWAAETQLNERYRGGQWYESDEAVPDGLLGIKVGDKHLGGYDYTKNIPFNMSSELNQQAAYNRGAETLLWGLGAGGGGSATRGGRGPVSKMDAMPEHEKVNPTKMRELYNYAVWLVNNDQHVLGNRTLAYKQAKADFQKAVGLTNAEMNLFNSSFLDGRGEDADYVQAQKALSGDPNWNERQLPGGGLMGPAGGSGGPPARDPGAGVPPPAADTTNVTSGAPINFADLPDWLAMTMHKLPSSSGSPTQSVPWDVFQQFAGSSPPSLDPSALASYGPPGYPAPGKSFLDPNRPGAGAATPAPIPPSAGPSMTKHPPLKTPLPPLPFWHMAFNPASPNRITSKYGPRNTGIPGASSFHRGQDYSWQGDPLAYATQGGRVIHRGHSNSFGNVMDILYGTEDIPDADRMFIGRYAHMGSAPGVGFAPTTEVGNRVAQGQMLGRIGDTGVGSGKHLHVERILRNMGDLLPQGWNPNKGVALPFDLDLTQFSDIQSLQQHIFDNANRFRQTHLYPYQFRQP